MDFDDTFHTALDVSTVAPDSPKESDCRTPATIKMCNYDPHCGLKSLKRMEKEKPHGGIVAVETGGMDLIISLIRAALPEGGRHRRRRNLRRQFPTLVVCKNAQAMNLWSLKLVDFQVLQHHGRERTKTETTFYSYDVVLTTYGVLAREKPAGIKPNRASPILKAKWCRVVLDEGHHIRNPECDSAQVACLVNAQYRWVLTPTPVNKKITDFFSLLKFLHVDPSDYGVVDETELTGCLYAMANLLVLRIS